MSVCLSVCPPTARRQTIRITILATEAFSKLGGVVLYFYPERQMLDERPALLFAALSVGSWWIAIESDGRTVRRWEGVSWIAL